MRKPTATSSFIEKEEIPLQLLNCISYRKIKILEVRHSNFQHMKHESLSIPLFSSSKGFEFLPCFHLLLPSHHLDFIDFKHRKWSIKKKPFTDITHCITILLNFHHGNYSNFQVIQLYAYFLEF